MIPSLWSSRARAHGNRTRPHGAAIALPPPAERYQTAVARANALRAHPARVADALRLQKALTVETGRDDSAAQQQQRQATAVLHGLFGFARYGDSATRPGATFILTPSQKETLSNFNLFFLTFRRLVHLVDLVKSFQTCIYLKNLAILMQMEAKKPIEYTEKKNKSLIIRQDENVRFSLDKLPYPDYSDLPMNTYMIPNGALCAISRGCIAKCTFCEETHFYKYRQRTAVSTLDEVRYMYHTYGTDVFYFTDSLVNGNLNELSLIHI